jgi:hypothetical protein
MPYQCITSLSFQGLTGWVLRMSVQVHEVLKSEKGLKAKSLQYTTGNKR